MFDKSSNWVVEVEVVVYRKVDVVEEKVDVVVVVVVVVAVVE